MEPQSKVIQIFAAGAHITYLYCLCANGQIWRYWPPTKIWELILDP